MKLFQRGKKGTYWVDFCTSGIRVRRSLKTNNRDEATRRAAILISRAAKEEWEPLPTSVPATEFFAEYLKYSETNKRHQSFLRDKTTIECHFLPFLGSESVVWLGALKAKTVEEYKISRRKLVSPRTVSRELETIKHALGLAVEWGYLAMNPAARVKKFRVPKDQTPVYWRSDEVQKILEGARGGPPWLYYMALTATYTGLRRAELCHLSWDDVVWAAHYIQVRASGDFHTKTYRSRQVPMASLLEVELDLWYRSGVENGLNGPYIFGTRHRDERYATKVLRDLLKQTELWRPGVGWHSFRHTFATRLAMTNCPMHVIASYLGHSTERTTELYAHVVPDLRGEFVERLGGC